MGNLPLPGDEIPSDERSSDEREIGWGEDGLIEEEADTNLARLLEDLPPHHIER
ncbi:hypothetical protein UG55_10248 [Frankia sp. EI5c]|uniref:hypothetical protein n=1 Tax=Frankia sp. EI5c TaxID=683316 RepID=UPI0007C3EDDE|nr:hypothetical protein [Frankia sp. EI5c]OAA25188.1 hypothetical protein UG55_10248 [Frankia sp. EI5c]